MSSSPSCRCLHSSTNVGESDYLELIDLAQDWFGFFSLVWQDGLGFQDRAYQFRADLHRWEHSWTRSTGWPGTSKCGGAKANQALIIAYRFDQETKEVLLRPGALFGWRAPHFPEDLAFYGPNGRLTFATVSHEEEAWSIDVDFGFSLPKAFGFRETEISEKDLSLFDYGV